VRAAPSSQVHRIGRFPSQSLGLESPAFRTCESALFFMVEVESDSVAERDRSSFLAGHDAIRLAKSCVDSPPERWYAALYQVYADLTKLRCWSNVEVVYSDSATFPTGLLGPLFEEDSMVQELHSAQCILGSERACFHVRCCIVGSPPSCRAINALSPQSETRTEERIITSRREPEVVIAVPMHAMLKLSNLDQALRMSSHIEGIVKNRHVADSSASTHSTDRQAGSRKSSVIFGFVDEDTTTAYYRIREGACESNDRREFSTDDIASCLAQERT